MKTVDEYLAIEKRDAGKGFDFYLNGTTRFTPEAATMRFANQSADTLTFSCPADLISAPSFVLVKWRGSVVFRGNVESVTVRQGKGIDRTATVTAAGPWATLARYCLATPWNDWASNAHSQWYNGKVMLPKHILNRDADGNQITLQEAIGEILDGGAATACGITGTSFGSSIGADELPADECRDVTAADAIRRIMRWYPTGVVRFAYGEDGAEMEFLRAADIGLGGDGADAPYLADERVEKLAKETTRDSSFYDGVALMVETVSNGYVSYAFQETGDASLGNPNCLRATLQVDGGSVNASTFRLKVTTEPRPDLTSVDFWKRHHPRLAGIAASAITITETFEDEHPLQHLCDASVQDMLRGGQHAQVESFGCLCRIATDDDNEEEVRLEMKFVTTDFDADGGERTISQTDSLVVEAGEVVPYMASHMLDEAIRANYREADDLCVSSERVTLRLGDVFPRIGDASRYLILQEMDVDCAMETATLTFSEPGHLSPADLAGMMTGFRNRRRPVSVYQRKNCLKDDGDVSERAGIRPVSTTEWAPGVKAKTTVRHSGDARAEYGSIVLDCESLSADERMEVTTLDNGTKVLATGPISASPTGMFRWFAQTRTIGGGRVCIGRSVAIVAEKTGCADGSYFLRCSLKDKTATIHLGSANEEDDAYNFAYLPLYTIEGGQVTNDFRGMPTVTAYE